MTAYYRSIFDTVRDFLHDEAMAGDDRILQSYLKPDLLIIDNVGTKQLLTSIERNTATLGQVVTKATD